MATLDLVPNPALMLAQASLFAANMYVVKHLIVDPYSRMLAKRQAVTLDRLDAASRWQEECETLTAAIDAKLDAARQEIKGELQKSALAAQTARAEQLAAVRAQTEAELKALQTQLAVALEKQQQAVPQAIAGVVQQAIHLVSSAPGQ